MEISEINIGDSKVVVSRGGEGGERERDWWRMVMGDGCLLVYHEVRVRMAPHFATLCHLHLTAS